MMNFKQICKVISITLTLSTLNALELNAKGAGVLPFFHSKNHKTYFLFSREAAGSSKGSYSDFGGGFEPKDKRFRAAAAREFAEESMGIFQTRTGKKLNEQKTLSIINKHNPSSAFINFGPRFGKYASYFIRVKNDPNMFKTFSNKRAKLLAKKRACHTKKLSAQTEKDVLVSVKKGDLIDALNKNNKFVKVTKSSSSKQKSGCFIRLRGCIFRLLKANINKLKSL